MLDYVSVDYPGSVRDGKVLDQSEYQEQLDFLRQVQVTLAGLPDHAEKSALSAMARELTGLVEAKRPGADVSALATRLRWALIRAYRIEVGPRAVPDLAAGRALYATHCAVCHGPEGRGDGPAGQSLDPKPSNFQDRERMSQRSIYGLYSTITLGVDGTPMVSFRSLSDADRWALAFYIAGLGVPAAETARGAGLWTGSAARAVFPDLDSVTSLSEADARARGGDDAAAVLAYLRTEPGAFSGGRGTALATSRALLEESLAAYRAGKGRRAQELAVASYLDGFELAEASIDTLDRRLRTTVETEMMRYRAMLREGAPLTSVEAQAARLEELLRRAETLLGTTGLSAGATFTAAFVILLREGLEAILVVAAIVAMLARSGRRHELRYVHLGWIAALAAGGLTWIIASRVVAMSGATREVTEGVTALVAAAMLLYVGVWMHSRTQARRWQSFLDHQLRGAPSGGTLWALTLAAFLAVYREAFETVLFYQTLWAQAGPGRGAALGAGFGAAAVALVFVGWAIVRGSVRLPLGLFFSVSSLGLALLAVVLAGQGVAALQEAGWLPASPVDAPSLPALGVYANVESLAVQLALLLLVALIFTWMRLHARRQGV